MLGNGFTVDVIKHILSFMNVPQTIAPQKSVPQVYRIAKDVQLNWLQY